MDTTQSPGQDGQNTQPGEQGTQQSNMVPQDRVNELTAQFRETQRQLQEQTALTQQLMAQNLQLVQGARQPAPAAPQAPQFKLPEGMDPTMAQAFQGLNEAWGQQFTQLQKQNAEMLQQVTQGVRATSAQVQLQQMLAGEHPAVAKRAQELMQSWQNQGYGGWNPKDAIVYARGEMPQFVFQQGQGQGQGQRAPNGQFMGNQAPWQQQPTQMPGQGFSPMGGQFGSPVPNPMAPQGPGERLPEETIARMGHKARYEYELSRQQAWVGKGRNPEDVPIIFD